MDAAIRFILVWGVPIGMTGAYGVLAWSSDTDTTGKAWMAIGLGFVWVIWYVFRFLMQDAALSRAVATGDVTKVLELTGAQLGRRRGAAARAPYLAARAHAYAIRGDWAEVLSTLAEADVAAVAERNRPAVQLTAGTSKIAALLGTREVAAARRALDDELAPAAAADRSVRSLAYLIVRTARGRVLAAEGDSAGARAELGKLLDDIRATSMQRATAHYELARLDEAAGDTAAAAMHRAEIAKLVPADAWVRTRTGR